MAQGETQRWPITEDLAMLRERVERVARAAGLSGLRLQDLVLAVHEAVINVIEHGGGRGTVTIWQEAGFLTVEVSDDSGTLTSAHLPDERPIPSTSRDGRGLWLMRRICDEFALISQTGRATVRLRMRLSPA